MPLDNTGLIRHQERKRDRKHSATTRETGRLRPAL